MISTDVQSIAENISKNTNITETWALSTRHPCQKGEMTQQV